jgi:predicted alpha/beta superfamily hydrolase
MRRAKRQQIPDEPGRRVVHENFASTLLGNARTLTVHLPPGYDHDSPRRYPVLYIHDGQNIFDDERAAFGVSWSAATTSDKLTRKRRIHPIILVAIDNTPDRHDEYAYWPDPSRSEGGRADLYGRFVVEEIKTFIDGEYRTQPGRRETGVAGASLGGLVSLTMAWQFPQIFSRCAILSPSLWWAECKVLEVLQADRAWMRRCRFWLCMGTKEGHNRGHVSRHIENTRRLVSLFDGAGLLPGREYYYWEVAGGEHNEKAWAKRLEKVLLYLYGW